MASDDDAEDSGIAEDPIQPQGARRSTFTPPPAGTGSRGLEADPGVDQGADPEPPAGEQSNPEQANSEQAYDDDALASALAEQFAPFGQTGVLPVTPAALDDFPAPTGAPVVFGTDDQELPTAPPAPSAEELSRFAPPTASPTGPVWSPPGPTRQTYTPPAEFIAPDAEVGSSPVPEPAEPEDTPEPAPEPVVPGWTPPADGVELPAPPERRSLADDALVRSLESEVAAGATLDAMAQLEEQLRLRQQDADDFDQWQSTMRTIGTPEAIDSIEAAIPTFTDVINLPTPDQLAAAAPAESWPAELVPESTSDATEEEDLAESTDEVRSAGEVEPASSETGQVDARPAETDQVEAEPVESDSVESAPVEAEPLEPAPVVYDLIEPVVVATPNDGVPLITSLDLVPEHGTETGSAADGDVWEGPSPDEPAASGPPERAHLPGFDDLIGFDDLLSGNSRVVAPSDPVGPPPPTDIERAFDGLFNPATPEPTEVDGTPADLAGGTSTESESVGPDSGSIPAASAPAASAPATSGPAVSAPVASAPAEAPIVPASVPVAIAPALAVADRPQRTSVFAPERSGIEPTPMDQRVGRAARMFWLWFATNSSLISLAFGGVLLSLGMSLRQAIVAALVGVAIAFLPLGLGTLAGKWSGQPTMIVSRASFGLIGNIVPASLAVITRVFWGAVLLWLAGASAARILVGNRADGTLFGLGETKITALAIALGFVLALAVAVLGYPLFARVQLVLTIVSAVLIVAFIVVSWHAVDVTVALTVGDGPWILVLTGAVLVVSFLGVVWATSSADLARYQRPSSSGAQAMLWAPFGATLPAFLLIAYGALLAASSPKVARGLVATPLDTIAALAPGWFPTPLLLGTVLSLLVGVVLSIYSGGFALQAVGLRVARGWSAAIVGVLVFVVALVLTLTVGTITDVFRDLATTLAVPVAAWAGIFAAEMILRRRRFDTASLVRRGGTYPDVNWVNLAMLIVASAVGFGLTTATVTWLGWQGYLFGAFGIPLDGQVAASDLGVLVALLLGLLTPFVSGVPAIRKQERQPRYFV